MDIQLSNIKELTAANLYQAKVTCLDNGKSVIVRVHPRASTVDVVWMSQKISEEAQERICYQFAMWLWG